MASKTGLRRVRDENLFGPEGPLVDEGARIWIENYARRHHWRVQQWITLDDLVQDGYVWFYECRHRYYPKVFEKSHFMALVKRCFSNHITDLANKRTRLPEVTITELSPEPEPQAALLDNVMGSEEELGTMAVLIGRAPTELKNLLTLLLTDNGLKVLSDAPFERREELRETTNERLARLIGYDSNKGNLLDNLRTYLTA